MAKSSFKLEHDFEKRRLEAARIMEKYPDRIPQLSVRHPAALPRTIPPLTAVGGQSAVFGNFCSAATRHCFTPLLATTMLPRCLLNAPRISRNPTPARKKIPESLLLADRHRMSLLPLLPQKIIRPIDSRLSYHFCNSADSQRMFAVSLLPEKIIPRFLPN
ncbi:Autophagy-related protein 8f [Platanthera guangdongensis]|uniref:Autophagy-related protein 8f n=1 Tax=Platanthera guangdongensis TaxID=2320717 RepID=A0ABR2MEV5_9ASPA